MTTWWASLSWSYATLIVLAVLVLIGSIACAVALRPRPMATRRVTPVVDYSAARDRAVAWLGSRYLLARPINRLSRRDSWRVVG